MMNRLLVIASMCGTMLLGQKLADFAPYQKDEGTKGNILSLDFEKGAPPEMVIRETVRTARMPNAEPSVSPPLHHIPSNLQSLDFSAS